MLGGSINVEVLSNMFKASHDWVLSVHIPISFPILQCAFGWCFLIRWVGFLVGFLEVMGLLWWLHFVSLRLESACH